MKKKAIEYHCLTIVDGNPLVFDVTATAPARLVDAYAGVDRGSIISAQQRAKVIPHLVFEVDPDATEKITRRLVLIPVGGWVGQECEDDEPVFQTSFINPLDGSPIAVYEVPFVPVVDQIADENDKPAANDEAAS